MSDGTAWLDATAQADAGPHQGGLAVGARRRGDRAHREAQPAAERGHPRAVRPGPRRGRRRAARRAVPGRALPLEGSRCRAGGHSLLRGPRSSRATTLDGDPGADAALHRRRLRHLRQDQHARARDPADGRAAALRALAQPVEHRALDRRVLGRIGGRRGVGHGARGPRQRRGRLHPDPCVVLRPGRA